jgi:hypothetical protein
LQRFCIAKIIGIKPIIDEEEIGKNGNQDSDPRSGW